MLTTGAPVNPLESAELCIAWQQSMGRCGTRLSFPVMDSCAVRNVLVLGQKGNRHKARQDRESPEFSLGKNDYAAA